MTSSALFASAVASAVTMGSPARAEVERVFTPGSFGIACTMTRLCDGASCRERPVVVRVVRDAGSDVTAMTLPDGTDAPARAIVFETGGTQTMVMVASDDATAIHTLAVFASGMAQLDTTSLDDGKPTTLVGRCLSPGM